MKKQNWHRMYAAAAADADKLSPRHLKDSHIASHSIRKLPRNK